MWNEILTEVIIWLVGIILSGVGVLLANLINTKVKNDNVKAILNGALEIVSDGVNYTYQTFVDNVKGTSLWDKDAMKEAQDKAVDYIKNNLSPKAIKYIKDNSEDIESWIRNQIEIAIQKKK